MLKLKEITCKNALVKSRISGVDYCLNPYTGCEHNCAYCYAIFMKRFTDHGEEWGKFVDVKVNFLERLEKEIKRAKSYGSKGRPGTVMLSSVTDPYQPLEEKYKLTRGALEILSRYNFPVHIQTKSDLVLRDIDLLKKLKEPEVGFTITCLDPEIQSKFEPGASSTEKRFEALKKLSQEGISTFIFFGPILPYFSDTEKSISSVFHKAIEVGVKYIYIDKMNYTPSIWSRLNKFLSLNFPELLSHYQSTYYSNGSYAEKLGAKIRKLYKDSPFELNIVF
ncbi:MAG: radical SAM protein [candidate division Zixibacteria bacterium]|nr:radical SAM protein [candidate division Zixibacteria bacterium]